MVDVLQNLISDHLRYGHAHAKLKNCIKTDLRTILKTHTGIKMCEIE